ncbi:ATP-grasp fold amidoligase family protein [Aestuariibius sp. 2305UL40-4]|uniref:ATP-grasp fold amidoligase family protein n=1 Tax=Aestuariibius violaceus TaxID=3234132 RepID=UPI00345E7807
MRLSLLDRLLVRAVELYMRRSFRGLVKRRIKRAKGLNGKFSLAVPLSADDKFLWRKIFDHDPRFPIISDKLELRTWIAAEGIDVALPKVHWVGREAAEIPSELLIGRFVAKANHGSGTNLFIENEADAGAKLRDLGPEWLALDYGRKTHEWGYFGIDRRLFIEERVGGTFADVDVVRALTMGSWIGRVVRTVDLFGTKLGQVYDPAPDGDGLVLSERAPSVCNGVSDKPLPGTWDRMLEIAREIGERFDHMRVDFLTDGSAIWLSELTVYNQGGFITLAGEDPESRVSKAWDIRTSWFLTTPQTGWRRLYAWRLRLILDRAAEA